MIIHRERLAGGGRVDDLSFGEDTEKVRDDGDWTATGEVGRRKYTAQLLVFLGIEVL